MKTFRGISLFLTLLLLVIGAGITARAEVDRKVPRNRGEINFSFASIVKRAAPAVVNVYAERMVVQRSISPLFDDPFFRRFFGGPDLGVPRQRMQRSLGSGVIIAADGIVITNHHVIKDADEVRVALADKREFEAEIILADSRSDLAVLRLKNLSGQLPFLEFGDSDAIEVGDLVLAIGNPFGVGQTVTSGIVSATARTHVGVSDFQFFIQTDAAINPGNSGGALIDISGRLIGINTAIYSRSGGSNGIGFAIPANMAKIVARSALSGKPIERPWLGLALQEVTPDIAEGLGLDRPRGLLVTGLDKAGPAKAAGIAVGDLIIALDGEAVDNDQVLNYRLATKGIGAWVALTVLRNGVQKTVRVRLEKAPETVPRNKVLIKGGSPFAGVVAVNLSPAVAEELRLEVSEGGVVIIKVAPRSPAARLGLAAGDIIREINGREIADTGELKAATAKPRSLWRFTIERGGRLIRMAVSG